MEQVEVLCQLLESRKPEVVENSLVELDKLYEKFHSLQLVTALEKACQNLSNPVTAEKLRKLLDTIGRKG
jgi:transcriptional regulator NrdR family protein